VTYWTLAIELMVGILVWKRTARPYVLALGVGLHLSVGLNLRLGFFSETMLAGYLAFLSPAAATAVILSCRDRFRALAARVRAPSPRVLAVPSDRPRRSEHV
jgi:hypothetical protein